MLHDDDDLDFQAWHEEMRSSLDYMVRQPDDRRSRVLTIAELRALQPHAPLIESLLDLDTLAMLYGRRGSHKSFLALDLALCVATGKPWHTLRVEAAPVIYVCAEGVHGLAQRIDAWKGHHGVVPDPPDLRVLPVAVNLLAAASVAEFAEACAEIGAKLVVIDTLSRSIVGGDENSAKDMTVVIEQLDVIRRRTGACVLVVHHSGKNGEAGARGSSALEAAADSVFQLNNANDTTTLTCTKQKHRPEGDPWRLTPVTYGNSIALDLHRLSGQPMLTDGVLATLLALAEIEVDGGASSTEWHVSSRKPRATFQRDKQTLVRLNLVSNVGTERMPRYQLTEDGVSRVSLMSQVSR